jgi:hypothetical protein
MRKPEKERGRSKEKNKKPKEKNKTENATGWNDSIIARMFGLKISGRDGGLIAAGGSLLGE